MEHPLRDKRIRLIILLLAALLLIALALWPRTDDTAGYAYPVPPANGDNVVEVLNGTARRGLARRGTRALRAAGFDVVFFGNAPDSRTDSTTILLRRGTAMIGARLREALGTGRVIDEPDSARLVDATVILGSDYQPPSAILP